MIFTRNLSSLGDRLEFGSTPVGYPSPLTTLSSLQISKESWGIGLQIRAGSDIIYVVHQ